METGDAPAEQGGFGGSVGGSAIGAAIGTIGQLISNVQQREATEDNNDYQRRMAEEAYQRDLEMWNRQNQYNSPLEQMKRWKDAGLNPNMIYGGANQGGNASSMPKMGIPPSQALPSVMGNMPNILAAYNDLRLRNAQIDNVKAQTDNTTQRTINETLLARVHALKGNTMAFDLDTKDMLRPYSLNVAQTSSERASKALEQQVQSLRLMRQDEQLNLLRVEAAKKGLTQQDAATESVRADNVFKQYRNEWMKMGVTSSDNFFVRLISRMMGESDLTPTKVMTGIKGPYNVPPMK